MTMDKMSKNYTKLLEKFINKWVVVSADYSKVVASGNTLEEIADKARKNKEALVFRVLPSNIVYSPSQL